MKNILFIMKYPDRFPETLKRKFDGQMDACVQLGYQAWYLIWNGEKISLTCRNTGEKEYIINTTRIINEKLYYNSLFFIDLYRAVSKISTMKKFDYVYFREMPVLPPALKMMNRLKKNKTFIIYEIPTYYSNTNNFNERSMAKRNLYRMIGSYISKSLLKHLIKRVDFITVIGENVDNNLYNKPALNISNGIDVLKLNTRKAVIENKINILLLASMCYWHGYDRVILGLNQYKGDRQILVHFVGNDGDGSLKKWKILVEKYDLGDKVTFHNAMYGKELDDFINRMDIGISSLGLFRENLTSASTMKSREYMARGLPFIYSAEDPTIKGNLGFVYQVSNDDSTINIEEVIEFADRFRNKPQTVIQMREYALKNMTWTNEFERIFNKIKDYV